MTVSSTRDGAIDYAPCRYDGSRLWFRGPLRSTRSPYVACLGGCAVFGRYVAEPFPELLRARLSQTVLNLGVENGSVDAYLNDAGALQIASRAKVTLIELSGSQNISNRYYAVHPRRNDRFVAASPELQALYPEMDFTEAHFTRHMLTSLRRICPSRFNMVTAEVRKAWINRMRRLVRQMTGEVVLFWLAPVPLSEAGIERSGWDMFLDRDTVEALRPEVCGIAEIEVPDWHGGRTRMCVPEFERVRAKRLAGPETHVEAADRLAELLAPLLKK